MSSTISPAIVSKVWISSLEEGSDDAEVENADGSATAELTDTDGEGEVAVHFTLPDETNALVSVYLTRVGALALAALLQHEAVRADIR